MKTSKKITFSFARNSIVYSKKQIFSTSSTAQIPGVDILWVVDNSGSMEDYRTSLSTNFPSFIDSFLPQVDGKRTAPYPFKMTAITTDAYVQKNLSTTTICSFVKCSDNGNPLVANDLLAQNNFELFKQSQRKHFCI